MKRITFDVDDGLLADAEGIASEMGLEVADLARSAFEGYIDGVRAAQAIDSDVLESS